MPIRSRPATAPLTPYLRRPYSRAHNQKMGVNQRDDAAAIGQMVVRGRNSLSLAAADGSVWVITLQLARRRSLEQVKALMAPPESLEAAAARVRRQVGGGDGHGSGAPRAAAGRCVPPPAHGSCLDSTALTRMPRSAAATLQRRPALPTHPHECLRR